MGLAAVWLSANNRGSEGGVGVAGPERSLREALRVPGAAASTEDPTLPCPALGKRRQRRRNDSLHISSHCVCAYYLRLVRMDRKAITTQRKGLLYCGFHPGFRLKNTVIRMDTPTVNRRLMKREREQRPASRTAVSDKSRCCPRPFPRHEYNARECLLDKSIVSIQRTLLDACRYSPSELVGLERRQRTRNDHRRTVSEKLGGTRWRIGNVFR